MYLIDMSTYWCCTLVVLIASNLFLFSFIFKYGIGIKVGITMF